MVGPHVLLVNSPLFRNPTSVGDEDYLPSLGLGIVANALRLQGARVEYIDAIFEKQGVQEIVSTIENGTFDLVGINIFTVNNHIVKEIVTKTKSSVIFVVGGLATRDLHRRILEWRTHNPIHVVCGDGEKIFPEIMRVVTENPKSNWKSGIHYHEIDTASPYFVADISNVHPARDIFKNEPFVNIHGEKEACIVTSRGCIYNCAFCAAARSQNQNFEIREASVQSIVRDIEGILERDKTVSSIRVLDDLYLKNRLSISRASATFSSFKLTWRAMAHVASIRQVEESDLKELARAGCSELFIGVESGAPSVLRRIHKTSNVEVIKQQLQRLFLTGIAVKAYFIFGFPGETEAEMNETLELASSLAETAQKKGGKFRTSVFQFRPYHGTELAHSLENEGQRLVDRDASFDQKLSDLVGRPQYNFESGNYSTVPVTKLREFIARTAQARA